MEVNDIYGCWTVKSLHKNNGRNRAMVECKCGRVVDQLQSNLTRGNTTKCRRCSYDDRGPLLSKRITGNHLAAQDKFYDYKVKATQRSLDFIMTFDEFLSISQDNCFYCGAIPSNINRIPNKEWADDFVYNGIDRLVNQDGYIVGNIVACCWKCNYMKRDLNIIDFMNHIGRIYDRSASLSV